MANAAEPPKNGPAQNAANPAQPSTVGQPMSGVDPYTTAAVATKVRIHPNNTPVAIVASEGNPSATAISWSVMATPTLLDASLDAPAELAMRSSGQP
jgi:hypothetical protein